MNFFRWKQHKDEELNVEIQTHLDEAIRDRIARGESAEEARINARREFGNVGLVKEVTREMWGWGWFERCGQDLRFGVRMLMKQPGFTLIAIFTLALGIGVNTALFSVFNALVLKPLPVKDPDGLVNFSGVAQSGGRPPLFSYLDYLDYRDRNTTLAELVAWNKAAVALGEAQAERNDISEKSGYLFGQLVSANYFTTLGDEMALGRGFLPEENRTPGTHPVIVLSHHFWQQQFEGDPQIIGKTIRMQSRPFTVVGVTAHGFIGTTPDTPAFWMPLMMRDQVIPLRLGEHHQYWLTEREADSFALLGRLKPVVTQQQARSEMSLIAQQLAQQHPGKNRPTGVLTRSGASFINLEAKQLPLLVPLLLAFGLVLLLACANVANLLLARAATRQQEIGIRLALGASRVRVIRQLLTENVLLAALSGVVGLFAAWWTLRLLYPVLLTHVPDFPAFLNLDLDYRIFGFTLFVALCAGVFAGLAPTLQASRPDLNSALKDEGSALGQHLSQSRLRNALVVTQVAVSLALLIGAGLLVRNLQRAQTMDVGFAAQQLISVAVNLNTTNESQRAELRRRVAERLRTSPGVQSVSEAFRQPSAQLASTPITLAGQTEDQSLRANYNFVSADHFETLGIQIIRGRSFTAQEANTHALVVVISEATAQKFWPGQDPLGQRLGIAAAALDTDSTRAAIFPSYEVIGVARSTRSGWVWEKDETYLYVPLGADHPRNDYLLVRAAGDTQRVITAVRGAAEAIDPRLSVMVQRTSDLIDKSMTPFRALALIAAVLGALALLLASIGLYGVMSFLVSQRTHEVGIRLALGAEPRAIIALFLRQGLRLMTYGLVLGLVCGAVISRLLTAALMEFSWLDPLAFGGASVCLTLVALLACYVPVRRATKMDPLIALRHE